MLSTDKRNRKITDLIELTVRDYCKLCGATYTYTSNREALFVSYENEDLFFVYPEFNENNFTINYNFMVYSNLALSKTAKLKAIYKSDEISE